MTDMTPRPVMDAMFDACRSLAWIAAKSVTERWDPSRFDNAQFEAKRNLYQTMDDIVGGPPERQPKNTTELRDQLLITELRTELHSIKERLKYAEQACQIDANRAFNRETRLRRAAKDVVDAVDSAYGWDYKTVTRLVGKLKEMLQ